jgi:hypothetical protein
MTEKENPAAESPADGVQDGRLEQSDSLPNLPANKAESLPLLIDRAAAALAGATTAAEVLEAHDRAKVAYTAAKIAARFAKAKDAHDTVIAACRKAQADALIIEAQAQCRLADEYDAAQERGDLKTAGKPNSSQAEELASASEIGLTHKGVHEARLVRDAERANPGTVRKAVEDKLKAKKEPTRSDVRRAVKKVKKKLPLPDCPLCEGAGKIRVNIYGPCGLKENSEPLMGDCACLTMNRRGNPALYDDLKRVRDEMVATEEEAPPTTEAPTDDRALQVYRRWLRTLAPDLRDKALDVDLSAVLREFGRRIERLDG